LNLLLRFIVTAIVFWLIAKYVPGFYHNTTLVNAIIAAIVFGIVNALIGPVLRLISLPLTIITLGLFTLVINYLLFVLTVHFVNMYDPSSGVNPWLADLYGAVIMMIVSTLMHQIGREETQPS
jgi:putative membrane protein